jgi:hypothetical protein
MFRWFLFKLRRKTMTPIPSKLPWTAYVDGDDVVVENVKATWFGGDNDPEDNGETASGVPTKGRPNLLGCALPIIAQVGGRRYAPTADSPLAVCPKIPWFALVEVSCGAKKITVELIDNGPCVRDHPENSIDLTQAAFTKLGGDLKRGVLTVSYRVKNVAKYLLPHLKQSPPEV